MALSAQAAPAADPAEIERLRQDLSSLHNEYERRLGELEARLAAAESRLSEAKAQAEPVAAPPPVAGPPATANALNPALSLILSGSYKSSSRSPEPRISGFGLPADAEVGAGTRGFSLDESELGLAAAIDPWLRGVANISFHPDDSVSVEEAFVETTSLGQGLTLKVGRFLSSIGYLNSQHSHTWDFADAPLAYQAILGGQYGDDGVHLNWIAPTELFVEVGAELGRGRGFPGNAAGGNAAGMRALTAHVGGDVGFSSNWRAGVSLLDVDAAAQDLEWLDAGGAARSAAFSGKTRVWVADAVWKWAPNGNPARTNFKLQGEWMRGPRKGMLDDGAAAAAIAFDPSGWYLQGVYQFMPQWRVGLRTEALDTGGQRPFGGDGFSPRKDSLMFDFSASEFSRVRVQIANDRSREGAADRQLVVQYQMSLGAHGAHSY